MAAKLGKVVYLNLWTATLRRSDLGFSPFSDREAVLRGLFGVPLFRKSRPFLGVMVAITVLSASRRWSSA